MHRSFALLGLVLSPLLVVLSGCGNGAGDTADAKAQDPNALLANAMDVLKEDRPSVGGFYSGLQQLDSYLHLRKDEAEKLVFAPDERTLIEKQLLGGLIKKGRPDDANTLENRLTELERKSYTKVDAQHLDSCFLFRDAAEALRQYYVGEAPIGSDPRVNDYKLELARQAFAWVMRQVDFRPAEPGLDAWPANEILRRGTGDGEERARVFLAVLEQLGLDGCMVSRTVEVVDQERKREMRELAWAPGVLIGGEVYLFETRLGKALPGPGGKGIATLRQVRKDPELLKSLYAGNDDPVTAAQLERAAIWIPSSLPALSPRMRRLQAWLLDANNKAVVHQNLPAILKRFRDSKPEVEVRPWTSPRGYPAVVVNRYVENPMSQPRLQEAIVPRKALMPPWIHDLERQLTPQFAAFLYKTIDSLFVSLRVQPTMVQEVEVPEQGVGANPSLLSQPRRVQVRTGGVRDLLVRGRPEQAVDRAVDLDFRLKKMLNVFYSQIESQPGKTEKELETKWKPELIKTKQRWDALIVERRSAAPDAGAAALDEEIRHTALVFEGIVKEHETNLVYLTVLWCSPEVFEHLTYFMALAKLELALRADVRAALHRGGSDAGLTPLQLWESAADWFERYQAHVLPRARSHWSAAAQRHLETCREAIARHKAAN